MSRITIRDDINPLNGSALFKQRTEHVFRCRITEITYVIFFIPEAILCRHYRQVVAFLCLRSLLWRDSPACVRSSFDVTALFDFSLPFWESAAPFREIATRSRDWIA